MIRTKEMAMDYLTMNDFEYAIHYAETINEWHEFENQNND